MTKKKEEAEILSLSKFRFRLFIAFFLIVVAILSRIIGVNFGNDLIGLLLVIVLVILATWLLGSKLESEHMKILKSIDREKSDFISVASHQLRTPLTAIQWVVERLLKTQKNLTLQAEEYLNDIHTSARRLSSLVDTLLNVSRIESGKISISPVSIEIVEFVKSYFSECMPLCDKKKISLSLKRYPEKLTVTTDENALRNIIQSLITNAIEYTPEQGSIEIDLEKKEETFVVIVSDTGIGIPKEEQRRIFQKFMRASNAKLVKTEGTGLGLYIASQAVELLGGKIWFESPAFVQGISAGREEGKGTRFYVELPLRSGVVKGEKHFAE